MKSAIFLLLVLIPSIVALKCYQCNSLEDSKCGNADDLSGFLHDCPRVASSNETYCRKIDQTIDGKKSIVRACGQKIGAKSCYKTAGANSANVCSCNNEDGCNHAASFPRQQQYLMTILSSMIALAISMIVFR